MRTKNFHKVILSVALFFTAYGRAVADAPQDIGNRFVGAWDLNEKTNESGSGLDCPKRLIFSKNIENTALVYSVRYLPNNPYKLQETFTLKVDSLAETKIIDYETKSGEVFRLCEIENSDCNIMTGKNSSAELIYKWMTFSHYPLPIFKVRQQLTFTLNKNSNKEMHLRGRLKTENEKKELECSFSKVQGVQ